MNRREKATRENGEQWRYDYNARGEVTSGVKAKSSATNAALRTGMQFGYDYDLIGNRIEESVHTPAGLVVQDWTANVGNQQRGGHIQDEPEDVIFQRSGFRKVTCQAA